MLTTHKTHLVLKPFYDEDRGTINTVCDSLDKKFIAAARTALPAALDALEASMKREAEKDAVISSLTAERDTAVHDIITMCQNCKHCTSPGIATIRCAVGGNLEATSPEVDFDGVLLDDCQCDMWAWRGSCDEHAQEKQRNGCNCASPTDEWHGWECSVTEGACMFLTPDAQKCAETYGEGPLADNAPTGAESEEPK